MVSAKSPPETTPVFLNQVQGVPICPPLQPIEKQCKKLQQAVVSATDNKVLNCPFVFMHKRSL